MSICKLPDYQSSVLRGRTAREFAIKVPDIQFSEWYAWNDIKNIPDSGKHGVYIIARFEEKPEGKANPLDQDILYIGETHGKSQSIYKRLNTFFKAAQIGNMIHKHSGGNRFNRVFGGDLTNIYAAGFAPEFDDINYVVPFICYAERKLIWEYVTQYRTLPYCNGY